MVFLFGSVDALSCKALVSGAWLRGPGNSVWLDMEILFFFFPFSFLDGIWAWITYSDEKDEKGIIEQMSKVLVF